MNFNGHLNRYEVKKICNTRGRGYMNHDREGPPDMRVHVPPAMQQKIIFLTG